MKVTVKHSINVRVGKPSVNAPTFQHLIPGTELEVDGKLYKGDKFEGIDVWLKDERDNYYWSGGIHDAEKFKLQEVIVPATVKFNYNKLLKLPDQFKSTKGEGIVVAILDTGCHNHVALGDSVVAGFDVFTKSPNQFDESTNGHGTFLAGLVAARESGENEIIGVAPLAKLIAVKVVIDDAVIAKNVLAGLTWLTTSEVQPDIINLSVDFNPGDLKTAFDNVFKLFTEKGTLIIAAGQNGTLIYSNAIFYPANNPSTLGIGCIGKNDVRTTVANQQIDFIVPDVNFLSTENLGRGYKNLRGSSMSAAFASGALALIRSWQKENQNTDNPVAVLSGVLEQLAQNNFDETLKIFKK